MMVEDDVKTAKYWGFDDKLTHISKVAPEPTPANTELKL